MAWLNEFAINEEITEMCYQFAEATLRLRCEVARSITCFLSSTDEAVRMWLFHLYHSGWVVQCKTR